MRVGSVACGATASGPPTPPARAPSSPSRGSSPSSTARAGIRANCVCPGATAGEGMGALFQDPDVAAAVERAHPLPDGS
jgi:hypothetical protein